MTFSISIKNATLSIMTFSIVAECCYAQCRMLNVANNPLMLCVVILNDVMVSVVVPKIGL
jgi:hypothetical protein